MKKGNTFLLLGCLFFLSPGLLKCDEIDNFAQALKKITETVNFDSFIKDNYEETEETDVNKMFN